MPAPAGTSTRSRSRRSRLGERASCKFIREQKKDIWQKITDSRQLDADAAAELEQAIAEFQAIYAGKEEKTIVA